MLKSTYKREIKENLIYTLKRKKGKSQKPTEKPNRKESKSKEKSSMFEIIFLFT